jgi:hypothetical protein
MANGYMPRKDADALSWVRYFSDGLSNRPDVFHVTPAENATIAAAFEQFSAAFARATTPETRTSSAVIAKNQARMDAELACRPAYMRIKSDPTISDADKTSIGVRPINSHRARIGPPTTMPLISLLSVSLDGHILNIRDAETPYRTRKAIGAMQVQLFGAIGEGSESHYIGSYSRNRVIVRFPTADNGKMVSYVARWITRSGETGPWSRPLVVPIVSIGPQLQRLAA